MYAAACGTNRVNVGQAPGMAPDRSVPGAGGMSAAVACVSDGSKGELYISRLEIYSIVYISRENMYSSPLFQVFRMVSGFIRASPLITPRPGWCREPTGSATDVGGSVTRRQATAIASARIYNPGREPTCNTTGNRGPELFGCAAACPHRLRGEARSFISFTGWPGRRALHPAWRLLGSDAGPARDQLLPAGA